MSKIKEIKLRKILDCRGGFTVEAYMENDNGKRAITRAPNSTSTGGNEVLAYPNSSVDEGIFAFQNIKSKLIGSEVENQENFDALLHEVGGKRLEIIGGNIATALSISCAKLASKNLEVELYKYVSENLLKNTVKKSIPRPIGNLIGGGSHTKSNMSIQEILISPNSNSFMVNAHVNAQVHKALGEYISQNLKGSFGVNVEGAWNTGLKDEENIKLAKEISQSVGKKFGVEIELGVDFAASEFYENEKYKYMGMELNGDEQIKFVEDMTKKYELVYLEDPMDEEDFEGFSKLTKKIGKISTIVGDDLYTTDKARFEKGVNIGSSNAILIKVNQIGTLTDTIDVIKLAAKNNIDNVVSHRSKDTQDTFISHLCVAFGSKFIKCGVVGGERISKLNEVARIQELEENR